MLNLNSFLLFSEHPAKLAEFYKKVFQKDAAWSEGNYSGFDAGGAWITIGSHDKVKGKSKSPERIIFNLETKDVKGEFKRIKALGATVVKEPYAPDENSSMWVATFSDPDGNYFQLMSPWEDSK